MKTTLNNIRKHSPCSSGWTKLLKSLNKTVADDEPLELSFILNSNGLDDSIWCLRSIEGIEKESRSFAVFCARQIQHLNDDPRVKASADAAADSRAAYYAAAYARADSRAARAYDAADVAAYYAAVYARDAYARDADVREKQKQKFIEMFC